MKTLKLDDNNNLVFVLGDMQIIDKIEALKQDLKNLICLNVGENSNDIDEGIDYTDIDTFGGIEFLLSSIRKRIESNKEVISVSSISHKITGSILVINLDVNTIYGNVRL